MTHVHTGQHVRITKPGKQRGKRGYVAKITDEDMVLVATIDGRLVPCFF